ncbi:MAG: hypothetical protein WB646_07870 [Steroidobacteraceae bacterium]
MNVGDPALLMWIVKASRAASRVIVTNGVFALVAVLLALGSFTLRLQGEKLADADSTASSGATTGVD